MIEPCLWHGHVGSGTLRGFVRLPQRSGDSWYGAKFKPWVEGLSTGDVVRICKFEGRESLLTKQLISQAWNNAAAAWRRQSCTDQSLELLDGPLTNLDRENPELVWGNWSPGLLMSKAQAYVICRTRQPWKKTLHIPAWGWSFLDGLDTIPLDRYFRTCRSNNQWNQIENVLAFACLGL